MRKQPWLRDSKTIPHPESTYLTFNLIFCRLDACVDLYRRFGCTVVCSGGGTPHRPPILNASKYVVFESMGCAEV